MFGFGFIIIMIIGAVLATSSFFVRSPSRLESSLGLSGLVLLCVGFLGFTASALLLP